MSSKLMIQVENVSKMFPLYDRPLDRLKQIFRQQRASQYHQEFWALKNVSFDVLRGQCVGVIGQNGSGKSTLLQIITGLMSATEGTVHLHGKVAALLELGSGFNPEFSGRENVYLNGALLGLSTQTINEKFDAIAAFADIGPHLEHAVKTYSSGMLVRLAFAVQIFVESEILIIDEALAVGDARFQLKCFRRLDELKEAGTTILFVSHAYDLVKSFCDFGLVLEKGKTIYWGDAKTATTKYLATLFPEQEHLECATAAAEPDNSVQAPYSPCSEINQEPPPPAAKGEEKIEVFAKEALILGKEALKKSWGHGGVTIDKVAIYGLEHPNIMHRGKTLHIFLKASIDFTLIEENAHKHNCVGNLFFGVRFDNYRGIPIFDAFHEIEFAEARNNEILELKFIIKIPEIRGGDYFLSFGAAIGKVNQVIPLFSSDNAVLLVLEANERILGIMNPEYTCSRIEAWDI